MYQRAMSSVCPLFREGEQQVDDRLERGVDDEEEDAQQRCHDHDHEPRHQRFAPRRPHDLLGLGLNLTDEFERSRLRHCAALVFFAEGWDMGPLPGPVKGR